MTKQDFRRLAAAVKAYRRAEGFSLTADQYEALVDQIALACSDGDANSCFSYARFTEVCANATVETGATEWVDVPGMTNPIPRNEASKYMRAKKRD